MKSSQSFLLALALMLPSSALAQHPGAPIVYSVSFENAVHHEAEIKIELSGLPEGPLRMVMSRSSPGRYSLHDFAKNVYRFRAFTPSGEALRVTHPTPHEWHVHGHGGAARVEYTLYGDRIDGTYAAIDSSHAHLNAPATFMWARGLGDREIRLDVDVGARPWHVATQLRPTVDPYTFEAPNLDYFLDSPIEVGDFSIREWDIDSGGETQTIRLAIHHGGNEDDVEGYAEMAKKVVEEEAALFGGLPRFDFGTYTFIADYLSYAAGDGMEHRNSTILTSRASLKRGMLGNLVTLAHEFLHCWNIERIRPRSLEPFDFEQPNPSGELWFGEGFTNYYDDLTIHRAGLTTFENYARGLAGRINAVINGPGRRFFSAVEMSRQAPFTDRASSADPQNKDNTFISYYTFGDAIALGLDLTLRENFGKSLDDFMRAVWRMHGVGEIPYENDQLMKILGEVAGDPSFAREYFDRYIRGREVVDYKALLATAGLLLRKANEGKAVLGYASLQFEDDSVRIEGSTIIGSPLYRAGLDRGDAILTIDGEPIKSGTDLEAILDSRLPGEEVEIKFRRRLDTLTGRLILDEDPQLKVVTYERAGLDVTDSMRRRRREWLGSLVER